jgi:hypothetical protein
LNLTTASICLFHTILAFFVNEITLRLKPNFKMCVCVCVLFGYFNFHIQTLIFDWCVVQWRSKNKHHKDTRLKEIGLHLQLLLITPHSIGNTTERTHVLGEEINIHQLPISITKSTEARSSIPIFVDTSS